MARGNHNAVVPLPVLKFGEDRAFETELHRRIDELFRKPGQRRTATPGVYAKVAFIFASIVTTYALLVFVACSLWQGLALAVVFGFLVAAVGVNVQHDGSHNAFSERAWVNKLLAMTIDCVGGSSYFWRWKHNRFHHTFTNVAHFDTDINLGILGRIAPANPRLWFHRWQHRYLWFSYGLLAIKWQIFDDFSNALAGRLGMHRIPRPRGVDLLVFLGGKAIFFSWAFVVPLYFHPVGVVLFFYGVAMTVAGLTLSMIFILPHAVGESTFPLPLPYTGRMANPRAVHQVRVTVDFMRHNPLVTWLVGGLNFHREHHLFPSICHVHYPRMAPIVDEVCERFGVPHVEHHSYVAGVVSHYHWLRRMGREELVDNQVM